MTGTSQQRVFDFLGDPATHGGAPVRRIDTHAASVFLAGERALKVKRAVRFPFLDYSTLAKRKAACEAELCVNRPFAPELYLGVIAITEAADGALSIGGPGEPVEWAVEMRRFDESRTLDHLAERGEIDAALATRLADTVAAAHAGAKVVRDGGWLDSFAEIIAQNEQELRQFPAIFDADAADALANDTRAAFERARPLMHEREAQGFVRRGHGDLHLGNIVMIGDAPTLFDAVEFSDAIATGDVFYDLAFLIMDLLHRRLDETANAVLNRYLQATGRGEDVDALSLLPLFLSVRAAIRAKVAAARVRQVADGDSGGIAARANAYFALAQRLIRPPPPMLVAVGGLSGTGKSVLARALAPAIGPPPGAVVLRSDVERKVLFGVAETSRLPPEAYKAEVNRTVYETLERKAARVLAAGHSVVVDAVYAREGERRAIRAVSDGGPAGVRFAGLFLDLDLAARKKRLGARVNDASDATADTADIQERYDLGDLDWAVIDASGPPDETFRRACEALKKS